eukprot:SAG11_NODE_3227_length_2596_cov_8.763316_3_plen_59_part_00
MRTLSRPQCRQTRTLKYKASPGTLNKIRILLEIISISVSLWRIHASNLTDPRQVLLTD